MENNDNLFGLVGSKLKHSYSPIIHNYFNKYKYNLFEINESQIKEFIIKRNYKGLNITIPYKETVLPFLDIIDPIAKEIGSVNTVINNNGITVGYNTDYDGLKSLLYKNKIDLHNKKILILGTGGTSKTAYYISQEMKANSIVFVSRKKTGKNIINYNDANTKYINYDIIINTTPREMYKSAYEEPLINLDNFNNLSAVIDVIYNPLNTRLLIKAKEKNISYANGLYMLVKQAAKSCELFTNCVIDDFFTNDVYYKLLKSKLNIVLIGMPGCGKSTIGKILAEKLQKQFIDTDEEIYLKSGSLPGEIIINKGEENFREIEHSVIKNLSLVNNAVISTGGGTILDYKNIEILKSNSIILFLDRNIDNITLNKARPLSKTKIDLKELYKKRISLYNSYSDFKIDNNNDIENTINDILKGLRDEFIRY